MCRMISSVTPSGCYNTIINWLKEQSTIYIPPPSNIDIVTFFDNNQILARNWNVRYKSKALVSVITTTIHLIPPIPSFIQSDASLSPTSWLYRNIDTIQLVTKIRNFISHYDTIFSQYRTSFIQFLLEKVQQEVVSGTSGSMNIPGSCQVPSGHAGITKVVTGKPIFLNPCSYRAVDAVLQNLKDSNCEENDRKWTMIGCDGLPYVLGSRLIEKDANLQDIFLIPGLGHFEMNMTKSCFKLLWNVILEDIAEVMGYTSTRAKTACQKCTDHHKAWQLLKISMIAVSKELVLPFVRECLARDINPSVYSFYTYMRDVKNPNVNFLMHAMLTYVFALFLFRAGERSNNSDAILAARMKFSSLFFGMNQTFYQEIEVRDLKARVLAPVQVNDFLRQNETFSVSGLASKGEGGDFILEAKNKKIKRMLPPGCPDRSTWERVCHNADETDKVHKFTFSYMHSVCVFHKNNLACRMHLH